MSKRQWIAGMVFVFLSLSGVGCARVKETGRWQFILVSEGQEMAMSNQVWAAVKSKSRPSVNEAATAMVGRVGKRVAEAADRPDFQWEFRLVDARVVNAFCLPRGKICVCEGILPLALSEGGLAAVMSHEVAHATARHGAENLTSRAVNQSVGQMLAGAVNAYAPGWGNAAGGAYGTVTAVGLLLPFNRAQEDEADSIGLIYLARAGYDPEEAVRFWERMEEWRSKNTGPQIPPFLSTHPTDVRRAERLRRQLPAARAIYESLTPAARLGAGETIPISGGRMATGPS